MHACSNYFELKMHKKHSTGINGVHSYDAVDADPMEYSQPGQNFERSQMEPPTTSGYGPAAAEEQHGGPRKLVRVRQPSPPCARNVFVDGPEDSSDISKILKRPPYVSRYRLLHAWSVRFRVHAPVVWLALSHPTYPLL